MATLQFISTSLLQARHEHCMPNRGECSVQAAFSLRRKKHWKLEYIHDFIQRQTNKQTHFKVATLHSQCKISVEQCNVWPDASKDQPYATSFKKALEQWKILLEKSLCFATANSKRQIFDSRPSDLRVSSKVRAINKGGWEKHLTGAQGQEDGEQVLQNPSNFNPCWYSPGNTFSLMN